MRPTSRSKLVVLALGLLAFGASASAHHSINSIYDSAKELSVEGVVTEFQFVYPHPFVIIAADADGLGVESWRLEMDNRSELSAIGMTAATLKTGDRVVVSGSPSRTTPRQLYLRRLDRPVDGFRYEQVGTRPRISERR